MDRQRWSVLLALPFLVAFTRPSRSLSSGMAAGSTSVKTTIEVTNENWNAVDVSLLRSGLSARLGTVATETTAKYSMPRDYEQAGADVRLMIHPIGSTYTYVTDTLIFTPGQTIKLDVHNNLDLTTVTVE